MTFVAVHGSREPVADIEQQALLDRELKQCAVSDEDCTFGRVLLRTGTKAWNGVAHPSTREAEVAIDQAIALHSPPFRVTDVPTLGMVAQAHEGGSHFTIVGLQSSEPENDDHHGYAEWLIHDHVVLDDFVVYYFDVAGIEFATPAFLAGAGALCCGVTAGLILIVRRWIGALKRATGS